MKNNNKESEEGYILSWYFQSWCSVSWKFTESS